MIHDVLMKTEKEKTKKKKREKKENSCLEVLISWVSEDSERIMGLVFLQNEFDGVVYKPQMRVAGVVRMHRSKKNK